MSRFPTLLAALAALALAPAALAPRAARAEEPPAPAAGEALEKARALVERLGSDDFRVREQASRDLAALGEAARPVLEKAMRESESLEVRWRAEQLLRRLDGQRERRLDDGSEPAAPGPKAERGRGREIERAWEEFRRRLEREFGADPWGGFRTMPAPRFGGIFGGPRIEAPGLALERLPGGDVELRVRRERDGAMPHDDLYRGPSLDGILKEHPELAELPGMAELRRKAAEAPADPFEEALRRFERLAPGLGGSATLVGPGSAIEISQQPGKTVVRIRERGEDGEEKVATYEGEDLEAIKKAHPELADRLRGFTVSFGPGIRMRSPRIFRDRRPAEGLEPLPEPSPPAVVAPVPDAPFGIEFGPVDEALASHLRLAPGHGFAVVTVFEGSQAQALGLQVHDVIVAVDGRDATDVEEVAAALRKAAEAKAPLALDVIREGKRQTLSR